jgi:hypothetical protein
VDRRPNESAGHQRMQSERFRITKSLGTGEI